VGQLLPVAGKDLRVIRSARNGDVGHAIVEQVFRAKTNINEHPVGGLSVASVTGHGIAVIQMRMLLWGKLMTLIA